MPLKTAHTVSVRQSTTVLNLSSILSSISETSLSNHLAVLRRDINAYYIDHLLTNPTSLGHSSSKDPSGISWQTLSLLPSPSTAEDLPLRLKNVAAVLDFLDVHLFAALPPSHAASFKKTLCKPITAALLQQFLVSHLPSSLVALPSYLHLVRQAKELEEKYIVNMLGQDLRNREIETWADAVSSHYEQKRRAQILEDARQMILRQDGSLSRRCRLCMCPSCLGYSSAWSIYVPVLSLLNSSIGLASRSFQISWFWTQHPTQHYILHIVYCISM
jgi:centromere/kinetochore protein ZW10